MKQLALGLALTAVVTVSILRAEEGMWTPEQLPNIAQTLRNAGLEIDPESLSDLMGHPMNAVISLGGCTASFVSPQGLVVTNHHCAYGSIQYNSRPDRNLLEDGFLAGSLGEELPADPSARVFVTVEFKDVTDAVVGRLDVALAGKARYEEIEKRRKQMVAGCEAAPGYRCRVADYHGGLKYSLIRQLEIRDVRLVYAPASGIGKFGGDIDNWMWPRHTGDYAFYRAYVAPDGSAADFSKDNVPYRPKHYLRVASNALKEGDFVMVAGYPGSTGRYRRASEVEDTFQYSYPRSIKTFQEMLDTLAAATQDRPDAALKYAGLESGLNNALKNNQGMVENFGRSSLLDSKRSLERELEGWVTSDSDRSARYLDAVRGLDQALAAGREGRDQRFFYGLIGRSTLVSTAKRLYRLAHEKVKPDLEREQGFQERDLQRFRQSLQAIDRRYDPEVDRAMLKWGALGYHRGLAGADRVKDLDAWLGLQAGDEPGAAFESRLQGYYSGTKLGDAATRLQWMDSTVDQFRASDDPFIRLAVALYDYDMQEENAAKETAGRLQTLRPRYMEALLAFLESRGVEAYPDANGTLRVTIGSVKGYRPRDAVVYTPFTTLAGILEKDTGVDPFNTPTAALEAMRTQGYGRFIDPGLGTIPVNFLSTCDSTGGNSGSATLNARGELVGLLFDGNYESMISDWGYLPHVTRSIHVDMRFVLWLMEEVDQAHRLLAEMGVAH